MTEIDIETLEQKYLNTIKSLVEGNLHNILRNLDSMNEISEYWRDISTDEGFDTGAETTSISKDQWEKIKSKINFEDLNISRTTQGVGGLSTGSLVKIKDEIRIMKLSFFKNFIKIVKSEIILNENKKLLH